MINEYIIDEQLVHFLPTFSNTRLSLSNFNLLEFEDRAKEKEWE